MVGKQTRMMLVCVASFFLVPHFCFMGIIYLLAFSAGLTYSAAYDERRWDRFAAMLPVSPWKIVGSKYLFYMAAVCGTGAVAAVSGWVQTKLLGGPDTTAAAAMAAALAGRAGERDIGRCRIEELERFVPACRRLLQNLPYRRPRGPGRRYSPQF